MTNIKLFTSSLLIVILLITIESKFLSRHSSKINLKLNSKDDNPHLNSNLNKTIIQANTDTNTSTNLPNQSTNDIQDVNVIGELEVKQLECMKVFTTTISKLINEKRSMHSSQSLNYNLYLALTAQKIADKMAEILNISENNSIIYGETSYGMTTEKDFDYTEDKCKSK